MTDQKKYAYWVICMIYIHIEKNLFCQLRRGFKKSKAGLLLAKHWATLEWNGTLLQKNLVESKELLTKLLKPVIKLVYEFWIWRSLCMYCVSLNKFLCLLYAIFSCNSQQIFIKFGFQESASNSSDLDWKKYLEKSGIRGEIRNFRIENVF